MKVIIADYDEEAIRLFEEQCKQFSYVELSGKFNDSAETLKYVSRHRVEAAFINIELNGMDGLQLGEKLRELNPKIVLVFFIEHTEYILEALRIKADGYMIRPYTMEDLTWTMGNAKLLSRRQKKPAYIRTFGRFDLFINGELVIFSNKKAKELLALCVDNKGGVVTMEEAVDKLWENRLYDEKVKNLYRRAVMDLNKIFSTYGIKDVFVKKRAACWINYANVDCDYYMWIEENMALAYRRGKRRGLRWAITAKDRARYREMLKELELGLEDRLSTKVGLLSGGQRQAITLLMATMNRPKLLLLDEHTAALDPKTAAKVLALSDKFIEEEKLTAMMVTHNMRDAIAHGNRLIMMNAGKIILDVRGQEKRALTVEALLEIFAKTSGTEFDNDRALLL